MIITDDYGCEEFGIGPYYCSVLGDGEKLHLKITDGNCFTQHEQDFPLKADLDTIKHCVAGWFKPLLTEWQKQLEALSAGIVT
jgi:hypothetical protein